MTVSREKAQASLDRVAKGYTVADDNDETGDAADMPLVVDETTPDVAELQRKYLSDDDDSYESDTAGATYDVEAAEETDGADSSADDGIDESGLVTIKPEGGADPQDASTRDRTAVMSKDGRVIGLQG